MPRPNPNIIVGCRVSAKMHYLRKTAFASAVLNVDTLGTVAEMYTESGINYCNVTFDALPDIVIPLRVTCLQDARPQPQQEAVAEEEPDLLDDAIQSNLPIESDNESEGEKFDMNWEECSITVDQRLTHRDTSYQYVNPSLLGLSGAFATPAEFFLHFLPCAHLQGVVIPAINHHTRQLNSSWIDLEWAEYLTWIMLLIIMTIVNCQYNKMYWRKSNSPYQINIDFTDYMTMDRLNDIIQLPVFVIPNGELAKHRSSVSTSIFLKAFNTRMAETMRPGRYMCVDESMNQWLGKGMPNLKKVPRKPNSIGQEYKTIADNFTCIIMRMDFCGDPLLRKPRPIEDRSIIATVKRLTEPWHYSGRVIVADSWFGSPEMARKLTNVGLHSIMQVCKRMYWPKGMPTNDIVQALGTEYGNSIFVKSTIPDEHLFVGACRDLKVKALVSICSTTTDGNMRRFWDPNGLGWVEVIKPKEFDDYESNKSSVDTSNNRRDNMISFHDVMRTYRWELRCLSFFLGVTEANAFSAFKYFHVGGDEVVHSEFRWRLGELLKVYVKELKEGHVMEPILPEAM